MCEKVTSASTYKRGNPVAKLSPMLRARHFDATGVSVTTTGGPKLLATSAVLSEHPLQTTIISNSPGSAALSNDERHRPMTASSLNAGMTMLNTSVRDSGRDASFCRRHCSVRL